MAIPILFFAALLAAGAGLYRFSLAGWTAVFLLGILASVLPFLVIHDVLFRDQMVIRRHFLPETFVDYSELEVLGPDGIRAGGRRLHLGMLLNADELHEGVRRWAAERTLKKAGGKQPLMYAQYPSRGYGGYASFWGILLGVVSLFLTPSWLQVDPRWLMGATFLVVYAAHLYLLPRLLN